MPQIPTSIFFFFEAGREIENRNIPDSLVQPTMLDATHFNDKSGISSQCSKLHDWPVKKKSAHNSRPLIRTFFFL